MKDKAEFREWLTLSDQGYAVRTLDGYVRCVNAAFSHDAKDPTKLLLSKTHSRGYKALVKASLLQWAEYTENPEMTSFLKSRKVSKSIASSVQGTRVRGPLPEEEYRRFLGVLNALRGHEPLWVWPTLSIACKLALRIGSDLCTGLKREACEQAYGGHRIQIWGKGGKVRELPSNGIQVELEYILRFRDWDTVQDIVAPQVVESYRYQGAYKVFRDVIRLLARKSGLNPDDINTHRLRKSSAYLLYKALDHDIDAVRRILGHTHTSTTQQYLGIDNLDEIGAVLEGIFE